MNLIGDIEMMMTLRSRVCKGESIVDLILDSQSATFLHECVAAQKLLRSLNSWTRIEVENC
jgi:hypothetical protein